MLTRCYNKGELERHPTYVMKSVCKEWLTFSKFKSWMETQDWEGKQLDKDILFEGNSVYSPETCVFIDQSLNKFLLEKTENRDLPIGVSYHKVKNKYIAASGGKQIGSFDNQKDAELAWCEDKLRQAIVHASLSDNERVAIAIVKRYTDKLEKVKGNGFGNL